ncbi:MAG: preprotein translocase subunit SecY [Proteobacteria bacterium]|nr:MAG: preprotein translocase subunit SecY [Pseudomonadota bacterium]
MSGAEGLLKIPELRKKIFYTLFALAVYRLGVHIPTPGVNSDALMAFFSRQSGTIFGWFNMFSGGALERFSIMALGVMPYISASIIFQLLTVVSPQLGALQKEGESGTKKINQYTRYATAVLCLVQGYGISVGLEQMQNPSVVLEPGMGFRLLTMVTLLGGTMFLMWLGEQITERGIGNGTSLIIFAGIASHIPTGIGSAWNLFKTGELSPLKLLILGAIIFTIFFVIIFMERGQRRIPIQYAKRVVGRKMYGGQSTHLPLKINTSGVIPPIFASSLIMLPATLTMMVHTPFMQKITDTLRSGIVHDTLFVSLIVFFCFFYTAVTFKTEDVADNLRKYGAFIPGIRPGEKTADFIDYVLVRITVLGAVYISAICVLPTILGDSLKIPFYIGGTSVLILVGVAMDTLAQVESHLLSRNYDTFMGNMRMKGRTGK